MSEQLQVDLSTVKLEMEDPSSPGVDHVDDSASPGVDHVEAELVTDPNIQKSLTGSITSSRLDDLCREVDSKELLLHRAWSALCNTLEEYKSELRQVQDMTLVSGGGSSRLEEEYVRLTVSNRHLNSQLSQCRKDLKEKELDLVSKVCQMGLMEAKLIGSEARNESLTMELERLRAFYKREGGQRGSPGPSPEQDPFMPLSVEQLNSSVVEAFRMDADATMRAPRRRGRPPGPGRGTRGRPPTTISMLMRGMGARRRRRSGRSLGMMQYKPRFISEMIAASEGGAESAVQSSPSRRGRGSSLPIRTLLHMNALGLSVNDNYVPPDQTYDHGSVYAEQTANGHLTDDMTDEQTDPFSDLYVDPASIKTEPPDHPDHPVTDHPDQHPKSDHSSPDHPNYEHPTTQQTPPDHSTPENPTLDHPTPNHPTPTIEESSERVDEGQTMDQGAHISGEGEPPSGGDKEPPGEGVSKRGSTEAAVTESNRRSSRTSKRKRLLSDERR